MPYITIIAVVAIVAVVLLVLNKGNLAGEAISLRSSTSLRIPKVQCVQLDDSWSGETQTGYEYC